MGTARAAKWKALKKKSFIPLPPDVDKPASTLPSLPSCKLLGLSGASPRLERPPTTTGVMAGNQLVVAVVLSDLLEPELSEDSEEDESDEDNDNEEDNCVPWQCDDPSESSDTDSIDSTSDVEC